MGKGDPVSGTRLTVMIGKHQLDIDAGDSVFSSRIKLRCTHRPFLDPWSPLCRSSVKVWLRTCAIRDAGPKARHSIVGFAGLAIKDEDHRQNP